MARGRIVISVVALALSATSAAAMPDARAVAEGLGHALGEAPPVDAVNVKSCTPLPSGPGFDCAFRIDRCVAGGVAPQGCDDPGFSQRAIFVGGDNGWLALAIQYSDEAEPVLPLDPSSPLLNEITPEWLTGIWNFESNCENDGGFIFGPADVYLTATSRGRWSLDGDAVEITITEQSIQGEGSPMEAVEAPIILRWSLLWMGRNVGHAAFDDGTSQAMIRC